MTVLHRAPPGVLRWMCLPRRARTPTATALPATALPPEREPIRVTGPGPDGLRLFHQRRPAKAVEQLVQVGLRVVHPLRTNRRSHDAVRPRKRFTNAGQYMGRAMTASSAPRP